MRSYVDDMTNITGQGKTSQKKTPFLLGNSQIGEGHPAQIDLDPQAQ